MSIRGRAGWLMPAGLFAAAFFASRAYFLAYPLTAIYGDSTSYYALAEVIGVQRFPDFSMRPPVYPLFLAIFLRGTLTAVSVAQFALSFSSGVAMIWAASRWRPWLAWPVAAAMAAFMVSSQHLEHDTAVLAESTHTSLIVLSMAFLFAGLSTRHFASIVMSSTAMSLAILTKPLAHFLLVIAALLVAFLIWNRYGARFIAAFVVPMTVLLLGMCGYNFATMNAFTTTAFGEVNIAFATLTFWEQDPKYPHEINEVIAGVQGHMRRVLTQPDREVLDTSWDPASLANVFNKGFTWDALSGVMKPTKGAGDDYFGRRGWIRTIAFDAIKHHPEYYAKFVYTQIVYFFAINIARQELDYTDILRSRAQTLYSLSLPGGQVNSTRTWTITQKYVGNPPAFVRVDDRGEATLVEQRSAARSLYETCLAVRRQLLVTTLWVWIYAVGLLLSTYRVMQTRARSEGPFILWLLNLSVLGVCLVVSLVEVAMPRYSYVTEFVYYLNAALFPLLWQDPPEPRRVAR